MDPTNSPTPIPNSGSGPRSSTAAAPPPQVIYVQSAPNPPRRWFSRLGWVGCFFAMAVIVGMSAKYQDYFDTSGGIQEKYVSGERESTHKIAVIEVGGLIGTKNDFVKSQIDRVRKDQSVGAVVLRVNSPGGTITGSDYILHHLVELRQDRDLPIVVSMGSIAASGGYYVAMAVGDEPNTIYAEPTTTTGSIGVIIPHYDLSGFLQRYDIKDDSIVSHPRKQLLSMTRPISADDRGVLEVYLQDAFIRFKDVIKSGRPSFREDESRLDALATGEIFTATRAQDVGLVDRLGFIEDAIERASELAGWVEGDYRVVRFQSPPNLMDALIAARADSPETRLRALLEFGIPKAYYLATSVPPLLTTWAPSP